MNNMRTSAASTRSVKAPKSTKIINNKINNLDGKYDPVPCSKTFDFVYIPPSHSESVLSPVKKGKYPGKTTCGWWFWTDEGYELEMYCNYIDIKNKDYMVIYDYDNDDRRDLRNYKNEYDAFSFSQSNDVLVGIETDKKTHGRGFSCYIYSYQPSPPEMVMFVVGGTGSEGKQNDVRTVHDYYSYGSPSLPYNVSFNKLVAIDGINDGVLISCGGFIIDDNGNEASVTECLKFNYYYGYSWEPFIDLHMDIAFGSMTRVEDELWVLNRTTILTTSRFGDESTTNSYNLPFDGNSGCLASSENMRIFVTADLSVYYNIDENAPNDWTNMGQLESDGMYGMACTMHEGKYYVSGLRQGGSELNTDVYEIKTSNFDMNQLASLNQPRYNHGMGIIGGRLAVIGGVDAEDSIEVYNNVTFTWDVTDQISLNPPSQSFGYTSAALVPV